MGADLGMDSNVEALESATNAGSWYDALVSLFTRLKSDRNAFGAAAKTPLSVTQVPTGMIMKWSGAADTVPDGWIACEGQALSRTTYAALFAKIGTTFGGSGTTFNLPDTRRRTTVGAGGEKPAGSLGPGASLGDTGGHETVTLTEEQTARHTHSLDLSLNSAGEHRHQVYETFSAHHHSDHNNRREVAGKTSELSTSNATLDSAGAHTHSVSGATGASGQASPSPVALASKTVVMTYIVKT